MRPKDSPAVGEPLLEEGELAELEPRDFRGADAATAAERHRNTDQLRENRISAQSRHHFVVIVIVCCSKNKCNFVMSK